jgi:hypothetical protein
LVSLLHLRGNAYVYAGLAVVPGKAHEAPVLYELVENFVQQVGQGVLKRLLLDRGFIDGKNLTRCKQHWGIDVLLPMKKNLDLWEDAWALAKRSGWQELAPPVPAPKPPPPERPEVLVRRELKRQKTLAARKAQALAADPADVRVRTEICPIKGFTSWTECAVPIHVLLLRDWYADGHPEPMGPDEHSRFYQPSPAQRPVRLADQDRGTASALEVLLRPERFPLRLLQRGGRPSGVHFAELHPAPMATLETVAGGVGRQDARLFGTAAQPA